jgi:hypothetical protein
MTRRAGQHPSRTYLAEHNQPGLTVEELERLVARVRESISKLELEGKEVRYLRSTIVPSDEVQAASSTVVMNNLDSPRPWIGSRRRTVYRQGGKRADRGSVPGLGGPVHLTVAQSRIAHDQTSAADAERNRPL